MIRKHQKKYFKRIVLKNIFKIQKQTAPRYVISWKNDLTMSGLTTKHPFKFRGFVNLSLDYLFIIFESFQFFFFELSLSIYLHKLYCMLSMFFSILCNELNFLWVLGEPFI